MVGFDPSKIIDQAVGQILSKPNLCPVTLLSLDPVIQSFDLYSQESANSFQKMAALADASFGEEMFKLDHSSEMTSENNNNNTVVSNYLLRLNCHRCPTASFKLERSQMVFTSATCRQQKSLWLIMGRTFRPVAFLWRKIHVTSEKQATHQDYKKLANGWTKKAHSPSVVQCLRLLFTVPPFISDNWVWVGSSRSSSLQLKPRSFNRPSSLKEISDK